MKSILGWKAIIDPLNVWGAWKEFAKGKRRRPAVAAFEIDAARSVLHTANELAAEAWQPRGYRVLRITDPKRRIVAAAPVRDRVVHHAIHRVLAAQWNRGFSAQSFACLPARGSHAALRSFLGDMRRFRFVLHLDIQRYFYSIDRSRLMAILARRLPEPALCRLISRILESGAGLYRRSEVVQWLGWSEPMPLGRGLPIGNLTSQWWGNVYLDGLDHFVQRWVRPGSYQRYMDDFVLFADCADELLFARDVIADWLLLERGLMLKDPHRTPRRTDRTQVYLGYRVSRRGFAPGPKLVDRLASHVRSHLSDPRREFEGFLTSMRAAWMFDG